MANPNQQHQDPKKAEADAKAKQEAEAKAKAENQEPTPQAAPTTTESTATKIAKAAGKKKKKRAKPQRTPPHKSTKNTPKITSYSYPMHEATAKTLEAYIQFTAEAHKIDINHEQNKHVKERLTANIFEYIVSTLSDMKDFISWQKKQAKTAKTESKKG